jgi:chemotaxis protein MotB
MPPKTARQGDKAAPAGAAEAADLRAKIDAAARDAAQPEPKVDVRSTDEGILISLTDDAAFSMFAIGSAQPDRRVVQLLAKVGELLKTRPGKIIIRGFTDGRPYKSAVYDNWRLSSARAHMVHYMLVRGGFDEARIERVEGYADRRLKNTADPGAPENRRIEILLREGKP